MSEISRRALLLAASSAPLIARSRLDRVHLSALTDEIGKTPAESIAFARQYGLKWVELRGVPGGKLYYERIPDAELRIAAKELAAAGLRVSFLNTGMLKFGLPGTEPVRRRQETPEAKAKRQKSEQAAFDRRMEDLNRALHAAHVFGTDKVRIFTFSRVAEPAKLFPRLVEIFEPMIQAAERARVYLLVENEGSCNVATCAELAQFLKLFRSKWIGINWDPQNGLAYKEKPYPDGYNLLPKRRILNVQVKARGVMEGPDKLDWAAIVHALEKDGYQGHIGLETHVFDGTLIKAAHYSIKQMIRIVEPSSKFAD